jgi:hypothetical protein
LSIGIFMDGVREEDLRGHGKERWKKRLKKWKRRGKKWDPWPKMRSNGDASLKLCVPKGVNGNK